MEEGGVGIVFHTSRGGRVLVVKSLVPGGAAERSCAVEVGHQIIAVGDQDVTSATLEEVAGLLRGPVNSTVQLRFLETRDVRLVVERTFTDRSGEATVGIKWKTAVGEFIVEGTLEEYSGFGGSPKPGDRLLRIDGESIDDMRDDEIRRKLAGDADSSVRLDFARGVAQHSVTLTRQALALAAITGKSIKSAADALSRSIDLNSSESASAFSNEHVARKPATHPDAPRSPGNQNAEMLPSTLQALPSQTVTEPPKAASKKEEDSVNQQLVDIVRRLKQELEGREREIVQLKAAHRKELQEAQAAGGAHAESTKEAARLADHARAAEQRARKAEEDAANKEAELTGVKNELNGVKSVLTRRAEAIGDSKKKMDEVEMALAQAVAEKDALAARCQHLQAAVDQSQHSIRELKSTRELDEKNLRAAADAALKWQIQEVEKQAAQTKADLALKTEEVARANETIQIQAQSMMSWQSAQETTQGKLSAAVEELGRVRKTNEELEAAMQTGSEEAQVQRARREQVEGELERARKELGSAEEQYTRALQEHERGWETRSAEVEETWKRKHAAQATQIASMQDQLEVGEAERSKMEEQLAAATQAKRQAREEAEELQERVRQAEERGAATAAELAETREKLEQASGRAEKLTDASHSWRDQLAAAQEQLGTAQKTIEAQAKACLQENNRREEAEERVERQQKDAERQHKEAGMMAQEIKELKELRVQHEVAKERLKAFDQLQLQLQNDARQRMQYMQRVSGNVPYQQLLVMLQDSNNSVTSLQGVVQTKERHIGVIQQQLTELSNVREMTVDAEKQLMKLKEALDWKTITLQQMTTLLSNCQGAMQKHGMPIPEELLEQLSDVLALQSSRRGDDDVASAYSQSPTALHSSAAAAAIPVDPHKPAMQPPPPVPGGGGQPALQMPTPAAVYGDPNLHSTGGPYPPQQPNPMLPGPALPPPLQVHSQPGNPLPPHMPGHGGLHSSMGGPAPAMGGPPPSMGGPGAPLHSSMQGAGPGQMGPGPVMGVPGQGFHPNPQHMVPGGVAAYPGQRDADFAMAM